MRRSLYHTLSYLLTGALLLSSCQNEYFQLDKLSGEIEIETDLVAPLIHGSLTMDDLVAWFDSSGYVGAFDDGLLYLSYTDTLENFMVDTLDLVEDGFYSQTYYDVEVGSDPVFIGSNTGETIHFRKSQFFDMKTKGNNPLDSILIKGGQLIYNLECTFRHSGYITLSSPYILDANGNPYSYTMLISNASGNYTWSGGHSLEGYFLKTDHQGDSSVFRMDYDLVLINSGNPVDPGDFCEINANFVNMGFYRLYGFVDPAELVGSNGELEISIYSDYPQLANLKLADPRINVSVENSMGIPFELTMDNVIATAGDGSTETLVFYEGHPFVIPAPDIDMVGETVEEEFHINNQTTNIQDLINIAPHTISYRVNGDIGSQNRNHFLLDTSRFMAEAEFLIPLDLSFSEYALVDTMDFTIGDEGLDTSIVKNVIVNLATLNELPMELAMQVYFLDEFHTAFDSLFTSDPPLLSPSVVDTNGRLVEGSEKENSINLPAEKLKIFERTRFVKIEARMLTSGSGDQFVKFYSGYTLDIEISFYADLLINSGVQ